MRRILPMLFVAMLVPAIAGAAPAGQTFTASLSGGEEVPPNDSNAAGQTIFRLSKDGSSVSYKLIVANLDNVIQAHIHCGEAGVNGPVRVFLFGPVTPEGTSNGILSQGSFDPAGITCPDGTALLDAMRAGDTYVNVHTSQFPGGEIRGQIAAHGPRA